MTVVFEMDRSQFLPATSGHFEIATNAQSAQKAALFAFALSLVEARVVGCLERLLEHAEKVAAVVGHIGGGLERHVALADHVALAQIETIDPEFGRGEIERALDVIVAFGSPRAAIG